MTDLQIKFQELEEKKRANLAQEGLKERSVIQEELKTASQIEVNNASINKINAEIEKMDHEIANLDARTDLTNAEKRKAKYDLQRTAYYDILNILGGVRDAIDPVKQVTGKLQPIADLIGTVMGAGKSAASAASSTADAAKRLNLIG